ncbi:MAG: hypothetical protein PHF29_00455 [Candidatus Riflebacteria bacterium]|nr:hypothetical protein [Candidatus Riflebacteria bacterium]MDD3000208.1 hypothetical protein [Candidatus Riflebacteria bacterium]
MKCLTKEKLILYVEALISDDGALGNTHSVKELKKHLETCKSCSDSVNSMIEEDKVLKEEIGKLFERHSQAGAIMEKVRKMPLPQKTSSSWSPELVKLFFKWFFPALALFLIAIISFMRLPSKEDKIRKNVTLVSLRALDSSSYYNNASVLGPVFDKVEIDELSGFGLNGKFKMTLENDSLSELNIVGSMSVKIDDRSFLSFEGQDINIELINGRDLPLSVNGALKIVSKDHKISIERKLEKPEESLETGKIDEASVDAVVKAGTKALAPSNDNILPEDLPSYKKNTEQEKENFGAKLKFRLRSLPEAIYIKPEEISSEGVDVSDDSSYHDDKTALTEESYKPFDGKAFKYKD